MLKLWGMRSGSSLALLPGPFEPKEVVSDNIPPMGQMEILIHFLSWKSFNCVKKYEV